MNTIENSVYSKSKYINTFKYIIANPCWLKFSKTELVLKNKYFT